MGISVYAISRCCLAPAYHLATFAAFACCRFVAADTAQPSIVQEYRLRADASQSRLTKPFSCPAGQGSNHLNDKCPMPLNELATLDLVPDSGIAHSKDSNQLPDKVKTVWAPTLRRDPSQASDSQGWGPRRTASGANSSSQVGPALFHLQKSHLQSQSVIAELAPKVLNFYHVAVLVLEA